MLLAGCMAPGLKAKIRDAEAGQRLLTPAVIADCSAKVAKEFPNLTVVGPFVLNPVAAGRVNDLEYLLPKDGLVALVAPTTNTGLFGQENKGHAGCSYLIEDGRLVFQKMQGIAVFGPKIVVVR
jgi:hypothetical protein